MNILTDCVRADGEYRQLLKLIEAQKSARTLLPIAVAGLCDGATDAVYASLIEDLRQKDRRAALLICPDEKECVRIKNFLRQYRTL